MSKKQKLNKFKQKQKQKRLKEVPAEDRVKNLIAPLAQAPAAANAFKNALEKTISRSNPA